MTELCVAVSTTTVPTAAVSKSAVEPLVLCHGPSGVVAPPSRSDRCRRIFRGAESGESDELHDRSEWRHRPQPSERASAAGCRLSSKSRLRRRPGSQRSDILRLDRLESGRHVGANGSGQRRPADRRRVVRRCPTHPAEHPHGLDLHARLLTVQTCWDIPNSERQLFDGRLLRVRPLRVWIGPVATSRCARLSSPRQHTRGLVTDSQESRFPETSECARGELNPHTLSGTGT